MISSSTILTRPPSPATPPRQVVAPDWLLKMEDEAARRLVAAEAILAGARAWRLRHHHPVPCPVCTAGPLCRDGGAEFQCGTCGRWFTFSVRGNVSRSSFWPVRAGQLRRILQKAVSR
jgi:hypothetical protein